MKPVSFITRNKEYNTNYFLLSHDCWEESVTKTRKIAEVFPADYNKNKNEEIQILVEDKNRSTKEISVFVSSGDLEQSKTLDSYLKHLN